MKRFLMPAVAAALLAATGVAWSAAGGDGPQQDRLAGGGIFGPGCSDGAATFCVPAARSFSIDAASTEGGGAYGTYMSGRQGAGQVGLIGRVTCLQVDGNRAVAGGYVVEGAAPQGTDVFFVYMRDDAVPGTGSDAASANFFDVSTAPDLPSGFPRECPPVGNDAFGFGHITLTGGDVQIVDAK